MLVLWSRRSTNLLRFAGSRHPSSVARIFQGTRLPTNLTQHNLRLAHATDSGDIAYALKQCKNMKDSGISPDIVTYNHLLKACSILCLATEAWAIMDDMELMGIKPDRESCHYLINATRYNDSRETWEAVDRMGELGISFNAQTYSIIISRYVALRNLEMALQSLFEMSTRGLPPDHKTVQGVISLAAEVNSPRLALDLAASFEESSVRKLNPETWVNCLITSARDLYVDGVEQSWATITKELNVLPDEGLCIDVLHTAARHGLPDLASDVMRVLKIIGASWQEHHYAALIEALCRARRIKEAFLTLNSMQSENILPTSGTTAAIFEVIDKDADTLDSAWSIIDEIGHQGPLDIATLNVIIQAAVASGELHRAMSIYRTLADYHAKPNVDTFNFLLAGCIAACHRDLGDRLLADMKEAKVKPDSHVYENIVLLCLTQQTYEDAFFYLEEMKARKYRPTPKIYESLIRKCLYAGDTRYALAMEEMKQCGYQVSRHLRDAIRG